MQRLTGIIWMVCVIGFGILFTHGVVENDPNALIYASILAFGSICCLLYSNHQTHLAHRRSVARLKKQHLDELDGVRQELYLLRREINSSDENPFQVP